MPPAVTKRKPLGQPIAWTDADLDRLAAVTEADIEAARVFWRANAPRRYRELLEAQPVEDELTNAQAATD